MNRLFLLVCFILINFWNIARADEIVSFSFAGCTDAQGQAVQNQPDPNLSVLLETRVVNGQHVIFYNPNMLPQLLPESRAFLYAHECAWTNLGLPLDAPRTAENARKADCWATSSLLDSHLIKDRSELTTIENDLSLVAEDANLLPQPPRQYNLASCPASRSARDHGNVLDVHPTSATHAWDQCMQACGARLYACGRGSNCVSTFNSCTAGCKGR